MNYDKIFNISIIGVFIFIIFSIISQWLLIYQPLNFLNNSYGQFYIFIYHIFCGLILHSYWKSIVTSPGTCEIDWIPEGKSREDLKILVEQFNNKNNNKNSGNKDTKSTTVYIDDDLTTITVLNSKNDKNNNKARFCSVCLKFKPPRTNHCKQCKQCILKQDHHCPWINNCVGFRNQKFFIQFLFYVCLVTSVSILALIISGFYYLNVNLNQDVDVDDQTTRKPIKNNDNEIQFIIPDSLTTILFIFNFSGLIPVFLGVLGLFFYQLEFILYGYTPVEKYQRKSQSKYARKNGMKFKWKYDRGFKRNFKDVFGNSIIGWFFSIGYPKTDGTYFKETEFYKKQQQDIIELETKRLLDHDGASSINSNCEIDMDPRSSNFIPYNNHNQEKRFFENV